MVAKIKRRELLTGVASVAVLPGSVRPQFHDGDLVSLSLPFGQLVERTQELELRKCQSASGCSESDAAWNAWSDAIDVAEALSGQLLQYPARSLWGRRFIVAVIYAKIAFLAVASVGFVVWPWWVIAGGWTPF